jgi:hypothetical protein
MILVYSALVFFLLFVALTCHMLGGINSRTAEDVKNGDTEAAHRTHNIYSLRFGRYGLDFGSGWYGCKGIRRWTGVDPARIVDGKPIIVGRGIKTQYFHLYWGLKWPYPWTDVPAGWQRKRR